MRSFDFQPRTRVIFGAGVVDRRGERARELNFKRTLLVADHGMVASGHVDEAVRPLEKAGVEVVRFHDFEVNPDTRMVDYRGYGKATKPMLPMIAIPTTAGTGSEAQSYALISDAETHAKMACGD